MEKLYLFQILLIAFSCAAPNENNMQQTDINLELVKQYFTHFNEHEWDKMASLYTENAEFKDPSLGPGIVIQTRDQIIEKYSGQNEVFPDIRDEIVQVYPSGDKHVIVEFFSKGTAPDVSEFELPIATIFTIENGRISKDFTYYDNFEEE